MPGDATESVAVPGRMETAGSLVLELCVQPHDEAQIRFQGRMSATGADRVRVQLPQPNTVVQIELLVRDKTEQPWRSVTRGVAYRLRKGDSEITSPELAVGVTTDRYWLLRADQRGGGLG